MKSLLGSMSLVFSLCVCNALAQNPHSPSPSPDASEQGQQPTAQFVPAGSTSRYAITYMNSQTTANFRSATAISVNNQSRLTCSVTVEYFKGFVAAAVCTTTASISPGMTHDFCSRPIPGGATTCNSTCAPALVFDEGRAKVSSTADAEGHCASIAVDARLYHFTGTVSDTSVGAVGSPTVVRIGQGNAGQ